MENKTGFLFLANGNKMSDEESNSKEPITIGSFAYASMYAADKLGYTLYMGINRTNAEQIECTNFKVQFYNANIFRNIYNFRDNCIAYKNLCRFLKEHPDIEVIHCNTPIGGILGRICGRKFRKKVIYTAHGFHFYKGAPLKNWLLYYTAEKILAHYTDILITINQEDYERAKKFKLKSGGQVFYLPGVGIDLDKYQHEPHQTSVRTILHLQPDDIKIPESAFTIISVGDLNDNKNTECIIKAISRSDPSVHLLICGTGPKKEWLINKARELNVQNRVHFLGYRNDIVALLAASNAFVSASFREGLPRSTMEAMAIGLPCIVSDIRGNRDLIENGKGGYLVPPTDANGFADAIDKIASNASLRESMQEYNLHKIRQFDLEIVKSAMLDIYRKILN